MQTVKPRARHVFRPDIGMIWHVSGDGRGCIGATLDKALDRWIKCGLQLMGCEKQTIMAGLPRTVTVIHSQPRCNRY